MSMRVEANKMRGISNIVYTGAELYKCVYPFKTRLPICQLPMNCKYIRISAPPNNKRLSVKCLSQLLQMNAFQIPMTFDLWHFPWFSRLAVCTGSECGMYNNDIKMCKIQDIPKLWGMLCLGNNWSLNLVKICVFLLLKNPEE